MARDIRVIDTCDLCAHLGIEGAPSSGRHQVAFDGPPKELDLCGAHEASLVHLMGAYKELGREVEAQPKRKHRRQADSAVTFTVGQGSLVQKLANLEQSDTDKETKPEKTKQHVRCPLPHQLPKNKPKAVSYSSRSSHAQMCHQLDLWDIEWEDPEDILRFPCTAHAECKKTNLRFASRQGLATHTQRCSLDRIDQN